jgi:hypothetical protein
LALSALHLRIAARRLGLWAGCGVAVFIETVNLDLVDVAPVMRVPALGCVVSGGCVHCVSCVSAAGVRRGRGLVLRAGGDGVS